jgi:hypothetical protein
MARKLEQIESELKEVKTALKAMLQAFKTLEEEEEIQVMPEGEYFGEKFE